MYIFIFHSKQWNKKIEQIIRKGILIINEQEKLSWSLFCYAAELWKTNRKFVYEKYTLYIFNVEQEFYCKLNQMKLFFIPHIVEEIPLSFCMQCLRLLKICRYFLKAFLKNFFCVRCKILIFSNANKIWLPQFSNIFRYSIKILIKCDTKIWHQSMNYKMKFPVEIP